MQYRYLMFLLISVVMHDDVHKVQMRVRGNFFLFFRFCLAISGHMTGFVKTGFLQNYVASRSDSNRVERE